MSLRFHRSLGGSTEPRLGKLMTAPGGGAAPALMPVATRGLMRGVPHHPPPPRGGAV
nr:tRNA-guanine(34) transglycosylase [Planctomycetota bacterium]